MSMISEQVKKIRSVAGICTIEVKKTLLEAADTIESLSAKLAVVDTERPLSDYAKAQKWLKGYGWSNDPAADDNLATICYALQEMEKYEALKKQGRLLKLPCRVGQKVYLLREDIKSITDGVITAINVHEFASAMRIFIIDDNRYTDASFDKIGENVFFTQEEADAALEEIQQGKGITL